MEPETSKTTFSSSPSGIVSQLSETTKELDAFVERLAVPSPSGNVNGNTQGAVTISGFEGVKFVPLHAVTEPSSSSALTSTTVADDSTADGKTADDSTTASTSSPIKQQLIDQLFAGFSESLASDDAITTSTQSSTTLESSSSSSTSSSQGSDATTAVEESIVLGEGMEIYIEMDDSEEGLFSMDSFFDMGESSVPTMTTTSMTTIETDADMVGSTTSADIDIAPPLSPSDLLLHEHNGAAYRLMTARRQQMIRQAQSTDERIVALKSKIGTM